MSMRRLTLALGAALLVGGWGTTKYASRPERLAVRVRFVPENVVIPVVRDTAYRPVYIGGVAAMAVGAGLIGFAVLPPTNRN